jgi:hypothetical protein
MKAKPSDQRINRGGLFVQRIVKLAEDGQVDSLRQVAKFPDL